MAVSELPHIDVVLLSHDHHADNLDDAGRELLATVGEVVTTSSGARRLGGATRGLKPWETINLEAGGKSVIEVTATPARHGPPLSRPIAGEVIGFAIRWLGQKHGSMWITGDSVPFRGMERVAQRLEVGLAIIHLGSVKFGITGPIRYSMTARESVGLSQRLGARTIVPVHYDGWSHFAEGRADLERELDMAPEDLRLKYRFLAMGIPSAVTA